MKSLLLQSDFTNEDQVLSEAEKHIFIYAFYCEAFLRYPAEVYEDISRNCQVIINCMQTNGRRTGSDSGRHQEGRRGLLIEHD